MPENCACSTNTAAFQLNWKQWNWKQCHGGCHGDIWLQTQTGKRALSWIELCLHINMHWSRLFERMDVVVVTVVSVLCVCWTVE